MRAKRNILNVSRSVEYFNVISRRIHSGGGSSVLISCDGWNNQGLLQQATVSKTVFQHNKISVCRFSTGSPALSPFTRHESDLIEKKVQENLKSIQNRTFEQQVSHPEDLQHFKVRQSSSSDSAAPPEPQPQSPPPIGTHCLPHPIWSEEELLSVKETHKKPVTIIDRLALFSVKVMRTSFDFLSGYNKPNRGEKVWLNRVIFLETVAGVPGMVAAMVRHLHSLRMMRRDHGWIHTLLEEAENERMHLMTALQLKKPGYLFRLGVVGTQGVFVIGFSLVYLVSPRFCHRFVGYLEEEAVHTYSVLLKDIESGGMKHWNTQKAPELAIRYWKLRSDATMKDVVLAIRADEAHHRVVNHTLGTMKPHDYNPYKPGQ